MPGIIQGPPSNSLGLVIKFASDYGLLYDAKGNIISWRDSVRNLTLTPDSTSIPTFSPRLWKGYGAVTTTGTQRLVKDGIIDALEGLPGCSMYMVSGGNPFGAIGTLSGNTCSGAFMYHLNGAPSNGSMGLWSDAPTQADTVASAIRNVDKGGSSNNNVTIASMDKQISIKCAIFDGTQTAANRTKNYNSNITKTSTITGTSPTSTYRSHAKHTHGSDEYCTFVVGALGQNAGFLSLSGNIFEIRIYNRAHSISEKQEVYNELNAKYGLGYISRVLTDGDSITAGGNVVANYTSTYPNLLQALLGPSNYIVQNIGVIGQKITDMLTDGADQVDTDIRAFKGSKDIVICNAGTNDIANTASNATTTYNNIVTYCQARQAAGFKVLVGTLLPRSGQTTTGTFETDRQSINTLIRANLGTFADGICDWGNDANMGQSGQDGTAYYAGDGIHPSPLGWAVMATYAAAAIDAL